MCDYFWRRMEGDQGDLADIVRAGGRAGPSSVAADLPIAADWPLPSDQSSPFIPASTGGAPTNDFGDPFVNLRDPLLHELTGMEFFDGAEVLAGQAKMAVDSHDGTGGSIGIGSSGGGLMPQKVLLGAEVKRPCNIFPRVAQISPGIPKPSPLSPRAIRPSPLATGAETLKASSSSVACCPVDPIGGVQIPSPRTPGTKRRKNQAKKVVCIPAPAAASNRPSGEVVPSDLWAWRKYGQKPIKGSPYPRGYYRCSSSKGCSARKQVERSRTDPNMLVITYTSEHNHPWPTQRNALAGSTRSQPSKNGSNSKSSNHAIKSPAAVRKEEQKEMIGSAAALVKEEDASEMDMANSGAVDGSELDQVFDEAGYKPMIPEANHADDFFADLAELDPDPMSLIFSKGLAEAKPDHDQQKEDKALDDPFSMFDWPADSSFIGEHKKGAL